MLNYCRGKLTNDNTRRCQHTRLKCPECGTVGCNNPDCQDNNFNATTCKRCFCMRADEY